MEIKLDNFCKEFDGVQVIKDMNLTIKSGEMIALLGPSGCGKTTTLFSICGIHQINGGRILFGGKDVTNIEAKDRNIGIVFQSYALYPHMTVFENIAFPLKVRKYSKENIQEEVLKLAKLVKIDNLLDRRPYQLSGGQQQRVALSRALVHKPQILLLDEPLANLDATLRLEMRVEIRRIQKELGVTAILVTHDQVEAMSMCDRIALMKDGEICQVAEPIEMYKHPKNEFIASFLGNPPISIIKGKYSEGNFIGEGLDFKVKRSIIASNGDNIKVGIRPEHIDISNSGDINGKIIFIENQGRETLYDIKTKEGGFLRAISGPKSTYKVDDDISWALHGDKILFFDEEGTCIS